MKNWIKTLTSIFPVGLIISSCFNADLSASRPKAMPVSLSEQRDSVPFYALKINSLEGDAVDLGQYRGRKIVLLNVASKCGYTPQYADWQKFFDANSERVVVLGFPSNDFGWQEPGDASEIREFCSRNYGVTFPMMEKVQVRGEGKSDLYAWLTDPARNGWNSQEPTWNFCKYVINEKGELTNFFSSKIKPDSEEFKAALGL